MQWAFTLEGQDTSQAIFVEVPDGTTPPNVGEKINAQGTIRGILQVKEREFLAKFSQAPSGNLTYGWSFVLKNYKS
jgi:hypothetical protein